MEHNRHPSEIQLLNYSCDLPIDDRIREHIVGCPDCQKQIEQLQHQRARLEPFVQVEKKLDGFLERYRASKAGSPARLVRWAPAVGVVLLLVVGFLAWHLLDRRGTIRLKGSVNVNVYVKRDAQVVKAGDDFKYRAGDKIRLGVVSPRAVRVTVLAEKSGGMEPIGTLEDVEIPPGGETLLPGSLYLDCDRDAEVLQVRIQSPAVSDSRTIHLECERP
jgi:hypothetical protein